MPKVLRFVKTLCQKAWTIDLEVIFLFSVGVVIWFDFYWTEPNQTKIIEFNLIQFNN